VRIGIEIKMNAKIECSAKQDLEKSINLTLFDIIFYNKAINLNRKN